MYISAGTDFLVEMEPESVERSEESKDEGFDNGSNAAGYKPSAGPALRLEITAKELRTVLRGLDKRGGLFGPKGADVVLPHGEPGLHERLLTPDCRAELCR